MKLSRWQSITDFLTDLPDHHTSGIDLRMAVNNRFPDAIKEHSQLSLVSDNGSQLTSQGYMKEYAVLGIKQIFASYNNPKGNADT